MSQQPSQRVSFKRYLYFYKRDLFRRFSAHPASKFLEHIEETGQIPECVLYQQVSISRIDPVRIAHQICPGWLAPLGAITLDSYVFFFFSLIGVLSGNQGILHCVVATNYVLEPSYSTSPRNRHRANRNHLEICLSSSQKNRNSLAWVVPTSVCPTSILVHVESRRISSWPEGIVSHRSQKIVELAH